LSLPPRYGVHIDKGDYTDLAKWFLMKGFATLCVDGVYQPTDNWPRLARHHEHDIALPGPSLATQQHRTLGVPGEVTVIAVAFRGRPRWQ